MEYYKYIPELLIGFIIFTQPLIKDYAFATLIFALMLTFFALKRTRATWFQRPFNISLSLFLLVLLRIVLCWNGYTLDFYIIGVSVSIITIAVTLTEIELHNKVGGRSELSGVSFPAMGREAKPIFLYLFNATLVASIVSLVLSENQLQPENILFLSVIGSLTAALLMVIPHRGKDHTETIGTVMSIWLFASIGYAPPLEELVAAITVALLISYVAYRKDMADVSAMITATLIGMLIVIFTDLRWFLALSLFFAIGSGFTKYKYKYKASVGLGEGKSGVRGYRNVFSNSLPAASLAIAYHTIPAHQDAILIAYLASLATALADTLASEIGQTSKNAPLMITTLKKTAPGTDGGVTLLGEAAAIGGALVLAVFAVAVGLVPPNPIFLVLITLGGVIGANIDSLFGATLQQKGMLTNNGVNLASTATSAALVSLLYVTTPISLT
ncbi:TIGR00297 family protein [Methanosarcinales archaeon ex4572_44]|nr:MAG: TIGR00297 family protein [Methanosarcinales archaeon ex4484_138]PHP45377.1 MAG: TIGR00297 family protein [Methanosarcinales archaeon ex4572_44]RLG25337.1 MAG: TIGR00297 family protein [Methanosarcinales archaeon]RLG28202.1 MAG: TIGR00297 family protein [Methanosarcinales archaeon]HHI30173.1 DUF92 domain-containing protein [Candidatus Methanoperedenaceae archaeon]